MEPNLAITFILPVLNEVDSLSTTVRVIADLAAVHLQEILIVTAGRTTSASLEAIDRLDRQWPGLLRVHRQRLPGLGGAVREAFDQARGRHLMLMAADLETDPQQVPRFVAAMQEDRWDIVSGSRWLPGAGFDDYGRAKRLLNRAFQQGIRLLYRTPLTDLTYGYRLYRREVLSGIRWQHLGHPFLLECLLKPLRLGARVTEVPCPWRRRREGGGSGSLGQMLRYLPLAVRIRCQGCGRIRPAPP